MTTEELIKKAKELDAQKDYQEIIDLLPDGLLEQKQSAVLYAWRGYSISVLGEYDKAIKYYNEAIRLKSDYHDVYNLRGVAWQKKGEYDKAIDDYNEAIRLKNDFQDAYYNRGIIWDEKGEYDKAIENYNEAIRLKNDYQNAYYNKGNTLLRKGEYNKAIESYNEAIRLKNDDYEAYNNRGAAWKNIGEYDKAIDDFNEAIHLNSSYLFPYRNKGQALEKKGNDEEAFKLYEEALSISHNDYWAGVYRNDVAARLGIPLSLKDINTNHELSKIAESLRPLREEEQVKIIKYYKLHIEKAVKNIRALASNTESIWQGKNMPKQVAHYTNLKIADLIIMKEEKKKEDKKTGNTTKQEARLRYSNAVFMNDPDEGKILIDSIDYLEQPNKQETENDSAGSIKTAFYNVLKEERTNFYLGSFLPVTEGHEDELLMWRTYGKDENANEAAGCSLVIDTAFFDRPDGGNIATGKEDGKTVLHPLYKVLYYNRRDNSFLDGETLKKEITNLKEALLELLKMKKRGKSEKANTHNKAIEKVLYHSLSELRYFFKSADYAYENELRVIQFATHADTVKIDKEASSIPRKVYIESTKEVKQYLKKIVLGPMVRHPERWMYLGKHMEDTGHKIDVVYSNCHFQ